MPGQNGSTGDRESRPRLDQDSYALLTVYFWKSGSDSSDLSRDKKIYFGDPLLFWLTLELRLARFVAMGEGATEAVLLSGSRDGAVMLWRLDDRERPLLLGGHDGFNARQVGG